jgi:hypothetical protein
MKEGKILASALFYYTTGAVVIWMAGPGVTFALILSNKI